MKIHVLGGGPGGLYAALLLKKADPRREVTLWERQSPEQTFGWGVVFSAETLGNLEAADAPSWQAMQRQGAHWQCIEQRTWAPEQTLRSEGHSFVGVGRASLLRLLGRRCEEVGVRLHFGEEKTVDELLDADLVIAADGAGSGVRQRWAEHFGVGVASGKSPYLWLGLERGLEAFTFSFRRTPMGWFQAHAYPYGADASMSTFIVECSEQTLAASGFEGLPSDVLLERLEGLFSEERQGARFCSRGLGWKRFRTIRCERWFRDHVVLLGDAAHTAHFSVGAGSKLALEDAIELRDALGQQPSIARALADYEHRAKERVGRVQKAAAQSQQWFEQAERHLRGEPSRVFFSLLSRTRRVTHENLRRRDPTLVKKLDDDFARRAGAAPGTPPCFAPFRLAGVELSNRFVASPMCQYLAEDGVVGDWHLMHLGSRAVGGAGMLVTEMAAVMREGRITPGCAGMWNDTQAEAWGRIVDFVHRHSDAKIALQLGHAGRKGSTKVAWEGMDEPLEQGGWPLIGPSSIPWDAENPVPMEMQGEHFEQVQAAFVDAARRAVKAGFDVLEVHLAHGYLLSSFLSPLSNQRRDAFGGSLENRARFPLAVVQAVREVWDAPLAVRLGATDWVAGGFGIDDAVTVAGWLRDVGVDLLDVSAGQTSVQAKPVYGRAFQTPFAERIRSEVGLPTMAVGNIDDHDRVNTILLAGRADLVALGRAQMADPHFVLRAAAELGVEVPLPPAYGAAGPLLKRMFG